MCISQKLLGAGPGVGKGRQIASLVFENLLRGRRKVRVKLVLDANACSVSFRCTTPCIL